MLSKQSSKQDDERSSDTTTIDEVWPERDTTPGRIEAALRRHAGRAPSEVALVRAGAGDEPRGGRRRRVPRRDREPPPARRPLPPVAPDPLRGRAGRTKLDAWAPIATEDAEPSPAHRGDRERIDLAIGPSHLPSARHHRLPAPRLRPGDHGVGAARLSRGDRRAAPARPDRPDRLPGRARAAGGAVAARRLTDDTYAVDLRGRARPRGASGRGHVRPARRAALAGSRSAP